MTNDKTTMSDTFETLLLSVDEAKLARQDIRLHIEDIDRQIFKLKKLKGGYLADLRDIDQHIIVLSENTGSEY